MGVTMRLELASGLFSVCGDRIQLQQVIINLVVNGMQAMAAVTDRERVLIVRTQRYQPDQVMVVVEDVGVGIEPENANRLFSAFSRFADRLFKRTADSSGLPRNDGPGMTFQFTLSASEQHPPGSATKA
jgi:signal transduction histidine kinase